MNSPIEVEILRNSIADFRGDNANMYPVVVRNTGKESITVKIPSANYVKSDNNVITQKSWGSGVNGNKGLTLLEGTFCKLQLVFSFGYRLYSEIKGDRILVRVELGKRLGNICFTFECTGAATHQDRPTNFVLIAATSENPPNSASIDKSQPSMASALKRIALLEDGLSEVMRNFDAMKRDFSKLEAKSKSGSTQTLSEVFAWLVIQERIGTAELRARLLPLNVLTGALVNEINELALDIAGEAALEEVGNEIVVTRKTLGQILGSLDVKSFEKRISS